MRTDRQTDMTKLIVAFGNFAKAPKKCVQAEVGASLFEPQQSVSLSDCREQNSREKLRLAELIKKVYTLYGEGALISIFTTALPIS